MNGALKAGRTGLDRMLPVAVCALGICLGVAVVAAWRWPLVGDASLIRYVVFLIHSGMRPYSQVIDINLPGSYLFEYAAMTILGWGAHGLRAYDAVLCGCLCLFSFRVGPDRMRSLAGLLAGLLTSLIHLHDGLAQGGQRDFVLAVLATAAVAVLIRGANRSFAATLFVYELLIGATLTVKPTLAPMALLPLLDFEAWRSSSARQRLGWLACGVGGLLAPVALAAGWLWREASLGAFVAVLRSIDRLHGEMGRRPIGFLLGHCMSPVAVLYLGWLVLILFARPPLGRARRLLLVAALCALGSYLVQGKGYPYQRYPFLALSLVLVLWDFAEAAERPGVYRLVGCAVLLCCGVVGGPVLARGVVSFDQSAPFEESLGRELAGIRASGGGTVQCLDTFGGCINTLYDQRIVQATGYLYDCYLFGPKSEVRDAYRAQFLSALERARPAVIVLTDQYCFGGSRSFDRVSRWPDLARLIQGEYVLASGWSSPSAFRFWSRAEFPAAYRVYVRKRLD